MSIVETHPHVLEEWDFEKNKDIDPKAGVLRLVFGLGTRAVDRTDDDYTRIISLNTPEIRPEENKMEILISYLGQ